MTLPSDDAIAIVGYGGLFPGADDLDAFWDNLLHARDATVEVPPGRWLVAPDRAFDPAVPRIDRVYATRGGFVSTPALDRDDLNLAGIDPDRLDPSFRLALHAASLAWGSARTERVDRSRVGAIFGNIVLPTELSSALTRELLGPRIEESLHRPLGLGGTIDPRNAFPAGLPAAYVARALGLRGAAYTIDAACASSLYAVRLAVDELRSGRADAMLTGGVSRPDPLYTQMGFSQLLALSARGRPSPFDEKGDGLIVGEGAGLFVLKRLGDAVAQGDTIHALIRGVGLSNDIHGDLLAPSSEGQLRAMRSAYAQAGWSPLEIDLIECHATGTPVGDSVEVNSLKQLWASEDAAGGWQPGQCVIGSVKSNVGHMLTAAGAAGLLKVLLAIKRRTLPPTANHSRTAPRLGLEGSPFQVLTTPRPWPGHETGQPRRAAISGFGFGGINAHAMIEEWTGSCQEAIESKAEIRTPGAVAIVGMAVHLGRLDSLRAFQERSLQAPGLPEAGAIDQFKLRLGQFRIPPREIEEMLPQQSLMLKVAAEALDDARGRQADGTRTGVLIGLGLDQNANNFQLRWWLDATLDRSTDDRDQWAGAVQNAVCPPLTANRTMGSLGGLVASRIAREFRIGGPSFTVSSDETSGTQALQIAAGWLERGELDAAVVGAVDLCLDPRSMAATEQLQGAAPLGEGAAAVVLKRLDDALRDGDRVYATLDSIASTTGELESPADGPAEVFGGATAVPGYGAVTGLATLVKAVLSLHQQVLPPAVGQDAPVPRFWLRNRADGPRRARVVATGIGGTHNTLLLAEGPRAEDGHVAHALGASRPLGDWPLGLFAVEADDHAGLLNVIESLAAFAEAAPSRPIDQLARAWWAERPTNPGATLGMAIVADGPGSLREVLLAVRDDLAAGRDPRSLAVNVEGARLIVNDSSLGPNPRVAFVYPGLGNVFAGMGRGLSVLFPDLLREQDERIGRLRDQFVPDFWWQPQLPVSLDDHRPPIFGQVAVGCFVTDLLERLGLEPDAAIGYSMGESAALVALRAWGDREATFGRLADSPLFASQLAGPCSVARAAWGLADDEPVNWTAGIVNRSFEEVAAASEAIGRVHPLIRNLANETVIGGRRDAVDRLVRALGASFFEVGIVSTVHCPVGRAVEDDYRALHSFPTTAPEGVTFYSGVSALPYVPTESLAAEAITAQAAHPIDYPALIERAHADGVRVFLEVGPGASCTRLIDRILGDRPHLARSLCAADRDPLFTVLEAIGSLIAARVPVKLDLLYGQEPSPAGRGKKPATSADAGTRWITIEPGLKPWNLPSPPAVEPEPERQAAPPDSGPIAIEPLPVEPSELHSADLTPLTMMNLPRTDGPVSGLARQLLETEGARAGAHEAFLQVARGFEDLIARNLEHQLRLIEAGAIDAAPMHEASSVAEISHEDEPQHEHLVESARPMNSTPCVLDRDQCMAFAVGTIAEVLGPEYAEIDTYRCRVRLPDEPLMLVDRITEIEGTPRVLGPGRVVTEHDVLPNAWYLDADRIPPCIAIESGQADLFLSGYLGIDFECKGFAVYRLLDATVTFHRGLPGPGEVIRHDIKITQFFRQGETHLFRFQFDTTVNGEPLLTMRDGCAGFFSERELAEGKGIVPRPLDARPRAGVRPADWTPLVAFDGRLSLDERAVDALRRGDLGAAFGSEFAHLPLANPLTLPGGRMTLVHRVETIEPEGGRFGLGLIRAEADIHPDDWFIVCHFVDDRVMPGTLMYECCLHTLRVFLMRMGWIGVDGRVAYEPRPGVGAKLRCRGQVVETTRKATYEITIKEIGYGPEPFAIADALMYADGKAIVEVADLSLQLTGTNREELEALWSHRAKAMTPEPIVSSRRVYGPETILAFAVGNPSDAFGDRYLPYDGDRFIARLPGPPYQFLDRVTVLEGEPWVMTAGAEVLGDYTVPADAWYFEADRQERMPYAVLIEAALQTCGWISSYVGSALTSPEPLMYRNLGGSFTQHAFVDRHSGTLTTRAKLTKVTRSAGMIIQNFDLSVHRGSELILEGDTYFGFFHPDALADQVGIREALPMILDPAALPGARAFEIPSDAPFPDDRWRMTRRIVAYSEDGGPHGLGAIVGKIEVDPDAWFFKAHFKDDPVWPGSLGLESFLQLLKVVAVERWGAAPSATFDSPGLGQPHRWIYRGQILPTSREVTTQAVITARDDQRRTLRADGYLLVDGRVIYQMNDYTLRLGD